ncbi:MAG: hypothetical protein AAF432_00720 [Planctomycetota bacterium]
MPTRHDADRNLLMLGLLCVISVKVITADTYDVLSMPEDFSVEAMASTSAMDQPAFDDVMPLPPLEDAHRMLWDELLPPAATAEPPDQRAINQSP